jgi:hypothetical protein
MRCPAMQRFRYDRPPSRASDAVQVRQAASSVSDTARADALQGPRVRLGGAPVVRAGGGGGVGKEAVCARQSAGMDVAKWRVFPPSLAPSPSAFPLLPASRPPSATPPHAARGQYLSSSHWSLVRIARGLARLVAPSGPMQLFLLEGRGGSRGVVRRGRWARRWQASHVESEAKRRPKQHRSAINQRVLIFIGEPAGLVTALPAHALRFAVRLHRPEMARH